MKSLMLGSAALVMAVSGARAADLPIVEAEPIEYVRVCDAYGAGYFYIPGTETCLKIGGYVRVEYAVHENENTQDGRWAGTPFTLTDFPTEANTQGWRVRGELQLDMRTETEMGLLRSFISMRSTNDDTTNAAFGAELAFIQFAGFTAGIAPSNLDFATNGFYGDQIGDWNDDVAQIAYTAQFGGGFSATIGIEDNKFQTPDNAIGVIVDDDGVFDDVAVFYDGGSRNEFPDLVANLRISQAWGEAMVGGVLRQNTARIELDDVDDGFGFVEQSDRELGYAIVGGVKVNLPFLAEKDSLIIRGAYGQGANTYVTNFNSAYDEVFYDAFFDGGLFSRDINLENNEAFSVYAGLTHYWSPRLRSNFVASYASVDYDLDGPGLTDGASLGFDAFTSSANIIYTPVTGLDVGLEVLYSAIDDDIFEAVDDEDNDIDADGFGAILRIQRSF